MSKFNPQKALQASRCKVRALTDRITARDYLIRLMEEDQNAAMGQLVECQKELKRYQTRVVTLQADLAKAFAKKDLDKSVEAHSDATTHEVRAAWAARWEAEAARADKAERELGFVKKIGYGLCALVVYSSAQWASWVFTGQDLLRYIATAAGL